MPTPREKRSTRSRQVERPRRAALTHRGSHTFYGRSSRMAAGSYALGPSASSRISNPVSHTAPISSSLRPQRRGRPLRSRGPYETNALDAHDTALLACLSVALLGTAASDRLQHGSARPPLTLVVLAELRAGGLRRRIERGRAHS